LLGIADSGADPALLRKKNDRRTANETQTTTGPSVESKAGDDEALVSDDILPLKLISPTSSSLLQDRHNALSQRSSRMTFAYSKTVSRSRFSLFNKNTELPLSLGDSARHQPSEERTLPRKKSAAREFLEAVMRPNQG